MPCYAADGSMLCALCNRGILSAIDVVGSQALAGVRMLVPKYILYNDIYLIQKDPHFSRIEQSIDWPFMSSTLFLALLRLNLFFLADLLLRWIWIILSWNSSQHLGYSGQTYSTDHLAWILKSICSALPLGLFFSHHLFVIIWFCSKFTCISEAVVELVRWGKRLQEELWGQHIDTTRGKKQKMYGLCRLHMPLAQKMRIEIEWLEFACVL